MFAGKMLGLTSHRIEERLFESLSWRCRAVRLKEEGAAILKAARLSCIYSVLPMISRSLQIKLFILVVR